MIKIPPAAEVQPTAAGSKQPCKPQDVEPFAQILQSSLLSCVIAPDSQPENQAVLPDIESAGQIAEDDLAQLAAGLVFLPQPTLAQDLLVMKELDLQSATLNDLQPALTQSEQPVIDMLAHNVPLLESTLAGYSAELMPAFPNRESGHLPDHQGVEAAGIDSNKQLNTKPDDPQSVVEPSQPEQLASASSSSAPAEQGAQAIERIQASGASLEPLKSSGNATRKPIERPLAPAGMTPDFAQRLIETPQASPSTDRPAFAPQSPTTIDWMPIVEDWPLRPITGPQQWTVRLRPDEFGQVQIQLERQGQGLIARIVADQVQTSELLRSQLMQLDNALQDKGIHCQRLEVLCEPAGSGPAFDHQPGRQPDHSGRGGSRDGSPPQSKPAAIASSRDQPAAAANHWPRRTSNRFEHWT